MKDAKVTIFEEKIILKKLKKSLLNFRLKSLNGSGKTLRSKKDKNLEKLSLNTFTTTINLLLFMKKE